MNQKREKTNATAILFLSAGMLIASVLLAVILFAPTAQAKPASVLLQEGLYAEEVEGNLDAAIEIYQKAVKQAAKVEKTAARATYRIGMCYLKKGEKQKAADYFEQITTKFPQQKALATRAQKQLEKLKSPVTARLGVFAPVHLVSLYNVDHPISLEKESAIDLDSGRLSKIPQKVGDEPLNWFAGKGLDLLAGIERHEAGLLGIDMFAKLMPVDAFDKLSPAELRSVVAETRPDRREIKMLFEKGGQQPVFVFRTREKGLGILQILDADRNVQRVDFRYKMLQEADWGRSVVGIGPDLAKARAMVPTLNALASSIEDAVDDNKDAETGLVLVNKLIEQGEQFQAMVKGSSAEGPAKAFFDMLIPLRQALEKKDLERATALFWTLDKLGDAVDDALRSVEDVTSEDELTIAQRRSQELRERSESLERLSALGNDLVIYANDDDKGRYPDTLSGLTNLHFMKKPDYEWAREFVEYLGKGKTAADIPNTILAYDKYLLQTGKGTNVLYNDTHVEFVKPDRLKKLGIKATPGEAPTFNATIYDNTGLDLDTGAGVPLKVSWEGTAASPGVLVVNEWPQGCDVAWDNDGGGTLMVIPDSAARLIVLPSATNWQQAMNSARDSIDMPRKSKSKGIFARQSKFVAVLTDQGNLAVIEIIDHDSEKGTIEWRLEKIPAPVSTYSVLKKRVTFLPDADTENISAILDLASGEMLRAGPGKQQLTIFRDLGKGDLAWDRVLICLRGAKAKLSKEGKLLNLIIEGQREDLTAYKLDSVPCRLLVTTAEGDRYEVTVLHVSESGINLEYGKIEPVSSPKETKPKAVTVSAKDKRAAENLSANGWQLWGQRKLAEAEKVFERAVDKDPGNANAWNGLGWSQFNQGKRQNARESFERCLEIELKHAAALNGLGWIAKAEGKIDEAIGHWEKAFEALPTATASLNGLATTYMERKEYDKAVKYYQMWLDTEPNNADAKEGLKKAKAAK